MKKIKNLILLIIALNSLVATNISAFEIGHKSYEREAISEFEVHDNEIHKTEVSNIVKYEYSGVLSEAKKGYDYKNATIRLDYVSKKSKMTSIGDAIITANFRYNANNHEAICLSTSKSCMVDNSEYSIDILCRRANTTTDKGNCFATIKLRHNGLVEDAVDYMISCDEHGEIKIERVILK